MVMGQSMHTTEVLVIGAGPGGYVAAIRAAQLGYSVTLVDKAGELGGMCLHHGCIPSKSLIHAMNVLYQSQEASEMGISFSDVKLDFSQTQEWKQSVIKRLSGGIKHLLEKHGIDYLVAEAAFQNDKQVVLHGEDLDVNGVEFRYCVVATGSSPRELDWARFGGRILSSREALQLTEVPERLVVVGGGYIGVELGVMLRKAGSKVTILEGSSHILGVVDNELSDVVTKRLADIGVDLRMDTNVEEVEDRGEDVRVVAAGEELFADNVLMSIGHVPHTQGLQLELAGVSVDEHGFIVVDEECRTSQNHIFAVGDVTGGMMLAHKASAQGRVAAEVIADLPAAFDPQAVPAVVFSDPEIATVGLTEQEARERYEEVRVGVFPFSALGRAIAIRETRGFVKVVADSQGVLLGVHGVGPGVNDYISEMSLALEMGASAEDLALTIHPHPTLSESLSEAAEALMGQAIHLYQPKNE